MDPRAEQKPHPSITEPKSLAEAKKYNGSVIWCGPRVWNLVEATLSACPMLHVHLHTRSRPLANTARQQQQGVLSQLSFVASIPAQNVAPHYIQGDAKLWCSVCNHGKAAGS
jgi:hypothetical protein